MLDCRNGMNEAANEVCTDHEEVDCFYERAVKMTSDTGSLMCFRS